MRRIGLALVGFATITMTTAFSDATERKDIPEKYKWKLCDLFPSDAAWSKAKDDLTARLPELFLAGLPKRSTRGWREAGLASALGFLRPPRISVRAFSVRLWISVDFI